MTACTMHYFWIDEWEQRYKCRNRGKLIIVNLSSIHNNHAVAHAFLMRCTLDLVEIRFVSFLGITEVILSRKQYFLFFSTAKKNRMREKRRGDKERMEMLYSIFKRFQIELNSVNFFFYRSLLTIDFLLNLSFRNTNTRSIVKLFFLLLLCALVFSNKYCCLSAYDFTE